jgi:ribonucleoside-diphosphate reductase alpha chain
MTDAGFPVEDVNKKPESTAVFSFPIKAPKNATTRHDMTAIDHLEIWQIYAEHWCEHKPSITVSVKEDEWLKVGAIVYENFDDMSGVSFLPMSEHIYEQAPYQDCTKEEYEKLLKQMPSKVDWLKLSAYEGDDNTISSQTLNCVGDFCEVVDLV